MMVRDILSHQQSFFRRYYNSRLLSLSIAIAAGHSFANLLEKTDYSLFNPVPREQLREMSTDRPDLTESPFTVDAGHFQIELDVLNYTYDRHNQNHMPITAERFSLAAVNLKAGLLNNLDIQFILEPYTAICIHDRTTGTTEKHHGFGDIITRLKINLWGNDSGITALGLMPFVKIPSNQDELGNNAVEGGLIVPFAAKLPGDWSLGAMTEIDFTKDDSGRGYHPEFINTITFGHGIIGNLAGYVEFFSLVSTESGSEWAGSVDFGLTYTLTENLQLDAGVNLGITRAADDLNVFTGISYRF